VSGANPWSRGSQNPPKPPKGGDPNGGDRFDTFHTRRNEFHTFDITTPMELTCIPLGRPLRGLDEVLLPLDLRPSPEGA